VFDERDQAVLRELGELIAHSIDAVETKQTLRADNVVELTITIRGFEGLLIRLARDIEADIHFDGLVGHSNTASHLFFTIDETNPDNIVSQAEDIRDISEIQVVRDTEEECTFKATVTEPTLASRILEHQAVIRSLTVTDTEATVVVDLPAPTEIREFLDRLRQTYSEIELVSRQTRDRPIKTNQELRDAIGERLTERQWEIIETAYRSGFFESPREQTGKQISAALDISQSTFTHHLREAERRLCELVFDNS
jgi:predicted DNA binding protein